MKLAVISCWKYRDAWHPFFALLEHFWPDHPQAWVLTDEFHPDAETPANVRIFAGPKRQHWSWCEELTNFAESSDEPFLLCQEDFFLNAPVQTHLVVHALDQLEAHAAGCVRLYPMPGGETEYGDPYFARVEPGTDYRVSCQAAIWRPAFALNIARRFKTASQFEIRGSRISDTLPEPVLAFKRDVKPWPLSYLCSAISRGRWNPDARRLCESLGIEADWTMRVTA